MTPPRPPRPSQRSTPPPSAQPAPSRSPQALNPQPQVVDPLWLLKALGLILLLALVCGYLTLCVLFYQGQWQLVLHPSRSTPTPSRIADTAVLPIHFGLGESAMPQLTGWWLPAVPTSRYAADTVLYLPSGDGSLADSNAATTLAAFHSAGINVFAFDYRGYGQSAPLHPNQQSMQQDAAFAWQYLTGSRHLAPGQIVLSGTGVGAALATQLAAQHPQVPALILRAPRPDLLALVRTDPRTRLLPVGLLFHDRFEIAPTLATLPTPKLLISDGSAQPAGGSAQRSDQNPAALYRGAADPKFTLYLPANSSDNTNTLSTSFTRFFDQYLPAGSNINHDTKPLTAPPLPTSR